MDTNYGGIKKKIANDAKQRMDTLLEEIEDKVKEVVETGVNSSVQKAVSDSIKDLQPKIETMNNHIDKIMTDEERVKNDVLVLLDKFKILNAAIGNSANENTVFEYLVKESADILETRLELIKLQHIIGNIETPDQKPNSLAASIESISRKEIEKADTILLHIGSLCEKTEAFNDSITNQMQLSLESVHDNSENIEKRIEGLETSFESSMNDCSACLERLGTRIDRYIETENSKSARYIKYIMILAFSNLISVIGIIAILIYIFS